MCLSICSTYYLASFCFLRTGLWPNHCAHDLWHIASQYQKLHPKTTVQQWMVAIFNNNPQAFQHGNMNGLLTGFRLSIPSDHAVIHMTNAGAGHVLNRHNHTWHKGIILTPKITTTKKITLKLSLMVTALPSKPI